MPPHPTSVAGGVLRKRLLTMPILVWHHGHDLVHLLDWQQPAAGPVVARLAAPPPSGRRRFGPRGCLGRIRRGGREELADVWLTRASSSWTRPCSTAFSARRAAFSTRSAAFS